MAADISSRFRVAKEMPPKHSRHGRGPRIQDAALDVATYIIRWDEESDDPEDQLRVIECVDDSEAIWIYQTCKNASHCAMVNHETRFVYDARKRGRLVFLIRKFERPRFGYTVIKKERGRQS